MLAFPPNVPPWTERRWFRGFFVQDDRREGPFQIGIDLDIGGTRPPVGYVVGDDTVADRLHFGRGPLQVVSVDEESRITAEGVHFGAIHTNAGADKALTRLIGEFSATNVAIREKAPDIEAHQTAAVFLLNGPSRFWPAWRQWKSDEYRDATFTIDNLTITVQPLTRRSLEGWHEPPSRVMQAFVRPTEPSAPDPNRFLVEATEAIDDVLTLTSLLHRGRIHWHERELHSHDAWTRTNRNHVNRWPDRQEPESEEYAIVNREKIYDFLRRGRTTLRQWRDEGYPLELPIAYRITGGRAGSATITQLFTSLFLSLENLAAIHRKRSNLQQIVPANRFDKSIKPALRNALVNVDVLGVAEREKIERKLVELNRPDFRDVLQHFAAKYRVTWTDLYPATDPPDNNADFIAVRNKLFHGAKAVSEHRIAAEIERLQLLLDRLFLRMLGWEDITDVWSVLIPFLQREWTLEPLATGVI